MRETFTPHSLPERRKKATVEANNNTPPDKDTGRAKTNMVVLCGMRGGFCVVSVVHNLVLLIPTHKSPHFEIFTHAKQSCPSVFVASHKNTTPANGQHHTTQKGVGQHQCMSHASRRHRERGKRTRKGRSAEVHTNTKRGGVVEKHVLDPPPPSNSHLQVKHPLCHMFPGVRTGPSLA